MPLSDLVAPKVRRIWFFGPVIILWVGYMLYLFITGEPIPSGQGSGAVTTDSGRAESLVGLLFGLVVGALVFMRFRQDLIEFRSQGHDER